MVCRYSVVRLAVDRALWKTSRRLEREPRRPRLATGHCCRRCLRFVIIACLRGRAGSRTLSDNDGQRNRGLERRREKQREHDARVVPRIAALLELDGYPPPAADMVAHGRATDPDEAWTGVAA